MSSEKYELAQDELDSLMEKIAADLRKTESSSGEAKKRMVQVRDLICLLYCIVTSDVLVDLYWQAGGRWEVPGRDGVRGQVGSAPVPGGDVGQREEIQAGGEQSPDPTQQGEDGESWRRRRRRGG